MTYLTSNVDPLSDSEKEEGRKLFTALEGSSLVPRPRPAFRHFHCMRGEPGNEAKREASFQILKKE